jgi:hypothetical protein
VGAAGASPCTVDGAFHLTPHPPPTEMADPFLPHTSADPATRCFRADVIWDSRDLAVLVPDLTTLCQPCGVG